MTDLIKEAGLQYGALLENIAIRCSKANNGGEWATHYNEDQKNVWRKFAATLIADIARFLETRSKE